MKPPTPKQLAEILDAMACLMRKCEAQDAHTKHLQDLAADARRTGQSQTHRIQAPTIVDFGGPIKQLCAIGKKLGLKPLQPNASPFALVPQDSHEALLARGMMWEECALCECGLHGGEECPVCHGDGGRYVPDHAAGGA